MSALVVPAAQAVAPATRPVPGGAFALGSADGRPDEAPVHRVTVHGFRLGRTPVTNAQYASFLQATDHEPPPWWTHAAYRGSEQPVVGVSWFDALAYCRWLSESFVGTWRLPTEAEWERAARGGLEGARTAWGHALPPGEVPDGPLQGPWSAGRGRPNAFDLLDMGTIVHEWCFDWYAAGYYAVSPTRDPGGPAEGTRRSSRGGSWRHRVRWSPPAARSSLPPAFHYADYGFRVLEQLP